MFAFSDLFVLCEESSKNDNYKAILSIELENITLFRAQRSPGLFFNFLFQFII